MTWVVEGRRVGEVWPPFLTIWAVRRERRPELRSAPGRRVSVQSEKTPRGGGGEEEREVEGEEAKGVR